MPVFPVAPSKINSRQLFSKLSQELIPKVSGEIGAQIMETPCCTSGRKVNLSLNFAIKSKQFFFTVWLRHIAELIFYRMQRLFSYQNKTKQDKSPTDLRHMSCNTKVLVYYKTCRTKKL